MMIIFVPPFFTKKISNPYLERVFWVYHAATKCFCPTVCKILLCTYAIIYINIDIIKYKYKYTYIYIHKNININISINIHINMYIYIYMYIYIGILHIVHTYIHTDINDGLHYHG